MRRAAAISALVLATAGCWNGGPKTNPIRDRIPGAEMATGFAMNGRSIAWVNPDAVVADLETGKRKDLGPGSGGSATDVALAGTTMVWLDLEGGNDRQSTLYAAAPGLGRKRLAQWFPDEYDARVQRSFGGIAGHGESLAYALWEDSPVGNPDACIDDPPCTLRVVGGGTFLVSPESLAVHRVLPPARAVAVDDDKVAAAVFRTGTVDTGVAQIVVRKLSGGFRRKIGQPARVHALALDGNRVAALIGPDRVRAKPFRLRVWNIADGSLVRALRVPEGASALSLAGSQAVLLGGEFFTVDIRSGRRHVLSHRNENGRYGPWVSGGRVWWVESYAPGTPRARTLLRSARLP
jgi:hypothetical protein